MGVEIGFCLSIDCFFNQLLSAVFLALALFHLGFNRRFEPLSEVSNESGLFWSPDSIKLDKDGLEMLEVRRPIQNILLLVLKVSLNPAPDCIHESPWVTKTLPKETFEANSQPKLNKNIILGPNNMSNLLSSLFPIFPSFISFQSYKN